MTQREPLWRPRPRTVFHSPSVCWKEGSKRAQHHPTATSASALRPFIKDEGPRQWAFPLSMFGCRNAAAIADHRASGSRAGVFSDGIRPGLRPPMCHQRCSGDQAGRGPIAAPPARTAPRAARGVRGERASGTSTPGGSHVRTPGRAVLRYHAAGQPSCDPRTKKGGHH
ncbi:hypothetical protein PHLGIDRAFT_181731 [Phlebiopsis gigantea 11061_1 CR5-6]|uniref:Uncharacterized protein n=1 Tax=Phlebiopsis gigantea (strain 11061_1 CR5-6) TaxID=745531 RepID=A0A0C3S7I2_PHLG1|nr:hypothetical protein PHLGIDRAFT_181731 [Phlebiopsis gigantea 11061_1 CR5-6]